MGEAKTAYENARSAGSAEAFVDAGFKLEEARIKYLVIQEIGAPEKQKIASDRLRAVNQLTKLIHDGRVAISGTPAETTAEKPLPAAPDKPADKSAADPAGTPAKPPADVTSRAAIPDPARQKEAEKLIKDLYKDQFAKKGQADRQALARTLLEEARKNLDDPASAWVLSRESQDAAVQACDLRTAVAAIDWMARVFDVDALSMKGAAFVAAGKAAKTPAECAAIAESQLKLIDEFIAVDQYDAAEKAAAAAAQHARRANLAALVTRASARVKETSEAKSKFQSLKSVLETLARNPDNPGANSEMGQFLCFIKGNWDLGPRFLAKGSDATLKVLAQKEISLPLQTADVVSLADGWWDLSEKEKTQSRKERLQERARFWYAAALPQASGLLKTKIEKRLEGAGAALSPGTLDLLGMIDPDKDTLKGTWKKSAEGVFSPGSPGQAHLQIPYAPPPEYDLKIVLTLKEGAALDMGIVGGSKWFTVIVNGWGGSASGIWGVSGKRANENETTFPGPIFERNKPCTLLFSIRKGGMSLSADGKSIIRWKGEFSSIVPQDNYVPRDPTALFLGTYESIFQFSAIQLTPVSGQGKKLR